MTLLLEALQRPLPEARGFNRLSARRLFPFYQLFISALRNAPA
jgi:hypothetical protein